MSKQEKNNKKSFLHSIDDVIRKLMMSF